MMDCGKSWCTLAGPLFPTILRQLHEGQQGQVKHNGSLLDSFPISNLVKQGCVLVPHCSPSSSASCSVRQKTTCQTACIRFRTDCSLFNLRRLLAHTKTIEELITELLFADDDCALLALTEEALQHIVNRFSDAAKIFGLTISPEKTEVLYQPPPR